MSTRAVTRSYLAAFTFISAASIFACSSGDGGGAGGTGGKSCDSGFVLDDNGDCVEDMGGGGTAGETGMGGSSANGGSGEGGSAATGGSGGGAATGGKGGTAAGGSPGTGGVAMTGGSPGTGGRPWWMAASAQSKAIASSWQWGMGSRLARARRLAT